jgi:hypothetical protein
MILMPDYKQVYVSCPKTGTQTLFDVFLGYYNGVRHGGMHENVLPTCVKDDWLIIISTRNPYRRAASLWWSLTQRNKDTDHYGARVGCKQLGLNPDSPADFITWVAQTNTGSPILRTMHEQYGNVLTVTGAKQLFGLAHTSWYWRIDTEKMESHLHEIRGPKWTDFMRHLPTRNTCGSWLKMLQVTESRIDGFERAVEAWCPDDFENFGYAKASDQH